MIITHFVLAAETRMTAISVTMPEQEFPLPSNFGENLDSCTAEFTRQCLVDLPRAQQNSWLLCASRKGQLQLVSHLLEAGASPNAEDDYGYTALMFLAAQGSEEGVQLMLSSSRCIVNKRSGSMQTALHFAAEKGHAGCVGMLLKAGAMANAADDWETPLIMAVNSGCLQSVEALLDAGANVEMTDLKGQTALMHAASNGDANILRCLLQHGACANRLVRSTSLHQAAKFGHLHCVDILLCAGVPPDVRDTDRLLPIELALQTDQASVVARLLQFEATREDREMIISVAAKHNASESLLGLLECGCSPQATDRRGIPAIFWAVSQNNVEVTKTLIRYNCDVNQTISRVYLFNTELQEICVALGEDFLCPLAVAARRGYERLVKILLVAGADPWCLARYYNADLLPSAITNSTDKELQVHLQEACSSPGVQPLTAHCRRRIRNCIRGNIQQKVSSLPLPTAIQEYIRPSAVCDL